MQSKENLCLGVGEGRGLLCLTLVLHRLDTVLSDLSVLGQNGLLFLRAEIRAR